MDVVRVTRAELTKVINRLNNVGWLLLGLSLGLADSIFWFVKNHGDPQCYQFPILSKIGCVSSGFAWEICFVLVIASAILVSLGRSKP